MRTNTKTTSKHYDSLSADGWAIEFVYETTNAVLNGQIQATAVKESQALVAIKQDVNQPGITLSGTYNSEIANVMVDEIAAIINEHTPAVQEG